jgi:preprotein translocase SecE subunit
MPPVSTKSQEEDEDLLDDDIEAVSDTESEVDEGQNEGIIKQAAISDRRRRRLRAQGIDPDQAPTSVDINARSVTAPKGRATPSQAGETRRTNIVTRQIERLREYFKDVRAELGRVTWLVWPDLRRLAVIILVVTTISAAFLGLISFVFGSLTGAIAQNNTVAGLIAIAIIIIVAGGWLLRDRLFPNLE